jgi:hypothetical protein
MSSPGPTVLKTLQLFLTLTLFFPSFSLNISHSWVLSLIHLPVRAVVVSQDCVTGLLEKVVKLSVSRLHLRLGARSFRKLQVIQHAA